ncbi:MAG: hypothetical protein AB7E51_15085 [Pseudodesulfovibrio sp.]|uniref:hypothetical protein n=1 Tax=Pseudodesulfovibrio sp. TaxID=2035812 RepID=UPI003D142136
MSESTEVRLARIEEMLKAHFSRDDERAKRWEDHEGRIQGLEASEQRRKGGWVAITTMCGVSGAFGAFIGKFVPWIAK